MCAAVNTKKVFMKILLVPAGLRDQYVQFHGSLAIRIEVRLKVKFHVPTILLL
jgi:hypothetical protein